MVSNIISSKLLNLSLRCLYWSFIPGRLHLEHIRQHFLEWERDAGSALSRSRTFFSRASPLNSSSFDMLSTWRIALSNL